jgi:hypothetical protein
MGEPVVFGFLTLAALGLLLLIAGVIWCWRSGREAAEPLGSLGVRSR